jgi:hypothetical protein
MEWKIVIHDAPKYVEVITSGIVDADSSLNMVKAIAYTMRTHRITKAMVDHSNVESIVGNIIDIYDRPKLFRFIGIILRIKIAEVIKPEHLEHFKFFETVCINRGYQVSIFQDKENALSWLLQ